jgi:hypothetical protein
MKFCLVVPEICRGQVHGARKERKNNNNNNNNNNNKKRSKNNKSPKLCLLGRLNKNMFPTTRNLQIRVHVFRPHHCCGD